MKHFLLTIKKVIPIAAESDELCYDTAAKIWDESDVDDSFDFELEELDFGEPTLMDTVIH